MTGESSGEKLRSHGRLSYSFIAFFGVDGEWAAAYATRYGRGMSKDDDDYEGRPSGFIGRLGRARMLAWIVIIGLVALSIGAISVIVVLQNS